MLVLVTGATGYLGAHVVDQALSRGHGVRALARPATSRAGARQWLGAREGVEVVEGDLLDERSLRRACAGVGGLVHCAALTGWWSRRDAEQWRVNVDGGSALLRAARRREVGRMVHVSSVTAVGCNRDGARLTEETPWIGRARPRVHYVDTKREAEERALSAARAGDPIVVVDPAAMLGPPAWGGPTTGRVAHAARRPARWVPRGGSSFADVADVARGCVLALERGRPGERYLLGGHDRTWRALEEELGALTGAPAPRGTYPDVLGRALALGAGVLDAVGLSRPPWAPERFRTWGWYTFADSSKAERELGYSVRPLEETLRRALAAAQTAASRPDPVIP